MDVFLYGILSLEFFRNTEIINQSLLELLRTPFAVNIGIFAALLVPFLAQAQVRGGLIWLSLICILVMTGAIFFGLFMAACCGVFVLAKTLQNWPNKSARYRYFIGFAVINIAYTPFFYVKFPAFEGYSAVGELTLFWGLAYSVIRAIHYMHRACHGMTDTGGDQAFFRYLHYMVHFPSFWFGPFQKFTQFDREVATCKERINWQNRIAGIKRILLGCAKFVVIFHGFNLIYFYKPNYYGPFADAFFADAGNLTMGHAWLLAWVFIFRLLFFVSAISDGVIGMNLLIGIRVPENSRWPFFAPDIKQFWQRWNIQTGVFLRDAVFFPVGGLRKRWLGLFCIFAYSGFWHFPTVSAILAFPLLQIILFRLTDWHEAFWKRHEEAQDAIYRIGSRYKLYNSWLSHGMGAVFVVSINLISAVLIHDHFFSGARLFPALFGLN